MLARGKRSGEVYTFYAAIFLAGFNGVPRNKESREMGPSQQANDKTHTSYPNISKGTWLYVRAGAAPEAPRYALLVDRSRFSTRPLKTGWTMDG